MLTAERLRELVTYDPATGALIRKVTRGCEPAGAPFGTDSSANGYINGKIDKRAYMVHRLVWLYVHGRWPVGELDHINGDRADNRIENLRDVSHRENMQNRKLPANNTSGARGVHFHKAAKAWRAQIGHMGKRLVLGDFPSVQEAARAYVEAATRLHTHSRAVRESEQAQYEERQ